MIDVDEVWVEPHGAHGAMGLMRGNIDETSPMVWLCAYVAENVESADPRSWLRTAVRLSSARVDPLRRLADEVSLWQWRVRVAAPQWLDVAEETKPHAAALRALPAVHTADDAVALVGDVDAIVADAYSATRARSDDRDDDSWLSEMFPYRGGVNTAVHIVSMKGDMHAADLYSFPAERIADGTCTGEVMCGIDCTCMDRATVSSAAWRAARLALGRGVDLAPVVDASLVALHDAALRIAGAG